MRQLSDGSVVPSYMEMESEDKFKNENLLYHNFALRPGTVSAMYYPDDKANISKKFIEYDVLCSQADKGAGSNFIKYRNVRFNSMFGGVNDSVSYTLAVGVEEKGLLVNGAKVLVLCVNGQTTAGGVIVAALPNNNTVNKIPKKADGQFYDFMFNGLNFNINNDGEMSITFNSPIDIKGKKKNEAASGTQINIKKDGQLELKDNEGQSITLDRTSKKATWTNGSESIVIDKSAKSVSIESGGKMAEKSKEDMTMASDAKVEISAKADAKVTSDANIGLEAKGNLDLKATGNWTVNVQGNANITAAGNAEIKAAGIAQIQGSITKLGTGILPVAAVGISQAVGGNGGGPLIATVISGSGTVLVGT